MAYTNKNKHVGRLDTEYAVSKSEIDYQFKWLDKIKSQVRPYLSSALDPKAEYTREELLAMLRVGIEYHFATGTFDKKFLNHVKTYAIIAGMVPAKKEQANEDYGDVMFVSDMTKDTDEKE